MRTMKVNLHIWTMPVIFRIVDRVGCNNEVATTQRFISHICIKILESHMHDHGVIAHEALHAAKDICAEYHMNDDEELIAYLVQYIVNSYHAKIRSNT
jgi:hypothetical protein